jgi:hypothetical protein
VSDDEQSVLETVLHPANLPFFRQMAERGVKEFLDAQTRTGRELLPRDTWQAPANRFLLNRAWTAVVEHERPDDQWWSFERVGRLPPHNDPNDSGRRTGRMRGYAIVRRGRPLTAFICEITDTRPVNTVEDRQVVGQRVLENIESGELMARSAPGTAGVEIFGDDAGHGGVASGVGKDDRGWRRRGVRSRVGGDSYGAGGQRPVGPERTQRPGVLPRLWQRCSRR